jgi:toxin ParE1/3/4
MQVKWTRKAIDNLQSAVEFIAKDKPMAASDVALKIYKAAQLLRAQPGMGRPGRVAGTRELVIKGLPFILPYTVKEGTAFILRVLHTSMKWPKKL